MSWGPLLNQRLLCAIEFGLSNDGFGSVSGVARLGAFVGYGAHSSRSSIDNHGCSQAEGPEVAVRPGAVGRERQLCGYARPAPDSLRRSSITSTSPAAASKSLCASAVSPPSVR